MPYDPSLDQSIFSKAHETDSQRVTVSIYSYNQGQKKLQITRETKDAQGEFKFTKLGRLNKEEITAILPLIQEAVKQMD
jgi:hypothetical protein